MRIIKLKVIFEGIIYNIVQRDEVEENMSDVKRFRVELGYIRVFQGVDEIDYLVLF